MASKSNVVKLHVTSIASDWDKAVNTFIQRQKAKNLSERTIGVNPHAIMTHMSC